jgi:hypothetical protein
MKIAPNLANKISMILFWAFAALVSNVVQLVPGFGRICTNIYDGFVRTNNYDYMRADTDKNGLIKTIEFFINIYSRHTLASQKYKQQGNESCPH